MLTAGFTACESNDVDYNPAKPLEGTQVYFPTDAPTTFKVDATSASVAATVSRSDAEGALEVSINAVIDPEYASLFTVAPTALFNDGQTTAAVQISFDRSKLVDGASYAITLSVVDESLHTPYAPSTQVVTISVPEPYVLMGVGLIRDDIITTIFSIENVEWEVEVYENTNVPGFIYLKNAYTSCYPYNAPGDYQTEDHYWPIRISDPTQVVFNKTYMGFDWGYGEFFFGCAAYGTLENGVITWPKNGLLLGMKEYTEDQWGWYANGSGLFRIVLPGVDLRDYSMTVAYGGMQVEADNTTVSAVLNGTYGADVASMRYAFFDGDVTAAAAQAAEIIIAAAEEEVGVKQFTQGLDEKERVFSILESKLAAPGVYTVFCVPYSADGEPQASQTATVSFYYPGVGGAEAPECEFAAYFYYVEDLLPSYASSYPATEYLMWLVEGVDIKSVNLAGFFTTAAVDNIVAANMANGLTEAEIYEVLVEEYGELLPDEYLAELSEYGYTFDVIKIGAPDVAVTYICTATNIYGSTKTVRCDGKTASATATAAASKGAGVLKPEFNPQFSGIFRMKEIK